MNDYLTYLQNGDKAGSGYRLCIPQRLPTGGNGSSLGKSAGRSLEFMDYRDYQPGDDLRHLDWNAYARSDKLTLKVFREEINPHADILIDGSASMNLAESRKCETVIHLAALLARAAINAGFSHNIWLASDGCHKILNSSLPPVNWRGITFSWPNDIFTSIQLNPPKWKSRGIRIVLSDLLWRVDPLKFLWQISEGSSVTIVVQILNEEDINGPEPGAVCLVDSETGEYKEILVDNVILESYRNRVKNHQENWQAACRKYCGVFSFVSVDRYLNDFRLSELLRAGIIKPS
ncbi:MAG: DUF58 domain-containing protein [Candidatus Riflebacteria bacterium]|nr:DUF58 domain-containing protein [Candidatus Riflebacteria bacterium]